jgi:hypothetical protein
MKRTDADLPGAIAVAVDSLAVERGHGREELRCDLLFAALGAPSYLSRPDAYPRSDGFRCGGRESDFLAVGLRSGIACWAVRREFRGRSLRSGVIGDVHTFDWMGASRDRMLGVRSR